jgi:hypothetical protein
MGPILILDFGISPDKQLKIKISGPAADSETS